MRWFICACSLIAVLPAQCIAKEYYYRCKYPNAWREYTINTSTSSVKDYLLSSIYNYTLGYAAPDKFVWKKQIRLGPYPNYNDPNKTVNEKHNYTYELNRRSLLLKEIEETNDYAMGKYWTNTRNYQCYEVN